MMSRWTKRNISLALTGIVLLIAVAFLVIQFPNVDQTYTQVIQVPDDFETVAAAVQHAQPGQTIEVDAQAGPYRESFIISQDDVSLVSVNGQAKIVFPTRIKLGAVLQGKNNTLRGFEIVGNEDQWLQFIGENVNVDNNKILRVNVLLSASEFTIRANDFRFASFRKNPSMILNSYVPMKEQRDANWNHRANMIESMN